MGSQAKEAVPALREATREADAAVRKAATEALGAVESSGATGGEAR
jgi:HEAT repeat protein